MSPRIGGAALFVVRVRWIGERVRCVVAPDLGRDTGLLQCGLELVDGRRWNALVEVAEHAEDTGLDRGELRRIGLELAVIDDRAVELGVR